MTAEQRAGLSDAALAMTQPCIDELMLVKLQLPAVFQRF